MHCLSWNSLNLSSNKLKDILPFTDFKEDFVGWFLCTLFNTASSAMHLSDSSVSEDAGSEPRNVATLALAGRRSNHWA